MKTKFFYLLIFISICSCSSFFENSDFNKEGYRDGSESGILINNGSLIGQWEKTFQWDNGGGEFPSEWIPTDIRRSDSYEFFEDKTFVSKNNIFDCTGTSGTYSIISSKLTLTYNCEPGITKEYIIDEFFFRESHMVFIIGTGTSNISKFELVP